MDDKYTTHMETIEPGSFPLHTRKKNIQLLFSTLYNNICEHKLIPLLHPPKLTMSDRVDYLLLLEYCRLLIDRIGSGVKMIIFCSTQALLLDLDTVLVTLLIRACDRHCHPSDKTSPT